MSKFNTEVTEKDLTIIDSMNGQGNVSSKGLPPTNDLGESLKGALNQYQVNSILNKEKQWIKITLDALDAYQTEMFEYDGLPVELNKYRLESKVLKNGSAAIIKLSGKLYACNYSTLEFNMYDDPTKIKVVEPKSVLDGVEFDIQKEQVVIFKNNYVMTSTYVRIYRYIKQLEKVLYQLEKNTMAAGKKLIFNMSKGKIGISPDNTPYSNSLEQIINGQNTAFEWNGDLGFGDKELPFWEIIIEDRTDLLIRQFTFFKELIKENLGGEINIHQKKERVITDEVENQQGLANNINLERFGVREICVQEMNEKLGTSITIKLLNEIEDEVDSEEENNATME